MHSGKEINFWGVVDCIDLIRFKSPRTYGWTMFPMAINTLGEIAAVWAFRVKQLAKSYRRI